MISPTHLYDETPILYGASRLSSGLPRASRHCPQPVEPTLHATRCTWSPIRGTNMTVRNEIELQFIMCIYSSSVHVDARALHKDEINVAAGSIDQQERFRNCYSHRSYSMRELLYLSEPRVGGISHYSTADFAAQAASNIYNTKSRWSPRHRH